MSARRKPSAAVAVRDVYETLAIGSAAGYHGFTIKKLMPPHGYSVQKGGFHVSFAQTIAEAKRIIDMLR